MTTLDPRGGFLTALAAAREEGLKEFRGLLGENARDNLDAMVERRRVQHAHTGSDGTAFGLVGAVNQPRDASLHQRSCTHGARFDRHVDRRAQESVIAGPSGGLPQGDHFSVSRGIAIRDGAIARGCKNLIFHHDERANRHFSAKCGSLGLNDGQVHEFQVGHGCGGAWPEAGIRYSTIMTS